METNRRQWGDVQTPETLAAEVCRYLLADGCAPRTVIEPTCGQGTFLAVALDHFPSLEAVYGVEVQPHYVQRARAMLAEHRCNAGAHAAPAIKVVQDNIFTHQFPDWLYARTDREILILGNPPWITNAELSTLASQNLPRKSNYRGEAGISAMTGKSNFDISESIIWRLLEVFGGHQGRLALLCKNSVIRRVMRELPSRSVSVADVAALAVDSRLHFKASVEASLLVLRLGRGNCAPTCKVAPLSRPNGRHQTYGWRKGKFVADLEIYERYNAFDGRSSLQWRQGIKHDCALVMELSGADGTYRNRLGEQVNLEPESLWPWVKGSDLKGFALSGTRYWLPVTQTSLGESTEWIPDVYPKLWRYLNRHRAAFEARKSAIYRGKPPFAMFGVGPYSFAPIKVAISGMHKSGSFTLISPGSGKPPLLDDTCYFLPFTEYKPALFTCALLNSRHVRGLLGALVFGDEKRPFTKELLMRIDLGAVGRSLTFSQLSASWAESGYSPAEAIGPADYTAFLRGLEPA